MLPLLSPAGAAGARRSGLLVRAVVPATVVACGGGGESGRRPAPVEPVPVRPAPARLQVRVAAGGFDVVVAGIVAAVDSAAPRPVPESGAAVFDSLAAGPRLVRLDGVAATCAVGGDNPRTLSLRAGQDTTITFDVVCRTRVARVALERPFESVLLGDTVALRATAYDASGAPLAGRAVAWSAGAGLTVGEARGGTAVFTGAAVGVARATATVDGVQGAAEVTVFAPISRPPRGFSYVADTQPSVPVRLRRLRLASTDGGTVRALTDWSEFVGRVAWAPAGDRLLVQYAPAGGRPAGVYLLDAETGRERLLAPAWGTFAWAPDGVRVAYSRYDAATAGSAVEVLDLRDGSTRTVLPGDQGVSEVAWSPDARRLAVLRRPVATGPENRHALWVVPLGAGTSRALALPTRARLAAWSPDGRRLAYDDGSEFEPSGPISTWLVDADGGNVRRLDVPCPAAAGAGCATGFPSWSPDGRRLALQQLSRDFLRSDGRFVTIYDPDARAVASATPVGGTDGDVSRWSGDGLALLFVAPRPAPDFWPSVVRVPAGGGSLEFLTTRVNAEQAAWWP